MAVQRRVRRSEDDERPRRRPSSGRTPAREAEKKKGLSAKVYKGLSEKRMTARGGGNSDRLYWKQGETVTVMFLQTPDEFIEYDIHSFKEQGTWKFVPCIGDDCPLCEDDDRDVSKTGYRFAANVYDFKTKSVKILEGGQGVALLIAKRFKTNKTRFLKKVWDLSKFDTKPASYDMDVSDVTPPRNVGDMKDLDKFVDDEVQRYFGSEGVPASGGGSKRTSLDDEDDEDADEDIPTRAELREMTLRELKRLARTLGIDTEDMDKRGLIRAIDSER